MTQPNESSDTAPDAATHAAEAPAAPKPPKVYPTYAVDDAVYVNRGKHRGQNGTIVFVGTDNQYGVKLDSGLSVVLSVTSLRAPEAPQPTTEALAGVFAEVRNTLAPPQRKAIDTLATALDESFPGFREAYDTAVDAAQPVAV